MTETISYEDLQKRIKSDQRKTISYEDLANLISQNPSDPQDPRLVDQLGIPQALEAGGGVVGGMLGTAGGFTATAPTGGWGAIPGGIFGGTMGTMAGYNLGNVARDLEDVITYGVQSTSVDQFGRDLAEQTLDTLKVGRDDLAFGTALYGAGRMLPNIYRFVGKMTGAQSPEVRETIADAMESGVELGGVDLHKSFL